MKEPEEDRLFSASDVREVADLSYRQLNDWDQKGLLPPSRRNPAGWRKFTPRELFVILICAEIRRRFGTPLESLTYVQSIMLQEGANHFAAAVEIMATFHMPVFLLTDLKSTFIMDHPFELADLLEFGLGAGQAEANYLLLKVNPLVNKLLSCRTEPFEIEENRDGYNILIQARYSHHAKNPEEAQILDLIRDQSFSRIEVFSKNGDLIKAYAERDLESKNYDEILVLLDKHNYQSITVTTHEGKTARLTQRLTFKFSGNSAGDSQPDQRDPGDREGQNQKADQ